jgi:hypothetical protein
MLLAGFGVVGVLSRCRQLNETTAAQKQKKPK